MFFTDCIISHRSQKAIHAPTWPKYNNHLSQLNQVVKQDDEQARQHPTNKTSDDGTSGRCKILYIKHTF